MLRLFDNKHEPDPYMWGHGTSSGNMLAAVFPYRTAVSTTTFDPLYVYFAIVYQLIVARSYLIPEVFHE